MRKRKSVEITEETLAVPESIPEAPPQEADLVSDVISPEEIAEPLVFKLAYLEERKAHLTNLAMLRMKVFDERMQQLKYERRTELEKIEHEQVRISEALKALRQEIEAKHNIKLEEYAYNDETGNLVRLPKDQMEVKKDGTA